jgi:hypothetical protein
VEPALIDNFFARQALLFEPDHAVNFRLLAYQEYLKQLYQSRRRLQPEPRGFDDSRRP